MIIAVKTLRPGLLVALCAGALLACTHPGAPPLEPDHAATDPYGADAALWGDAPRGMSDGASSAFDEGLGGPAPWPDDAATGRTSAFPAPSQTPMGEAPADPARPATAPAPPVAAQGIGHPPLGTAPPAQPATPPPAGPFAERSYPDLPPPVSHSYPPAGQSGFILEKRVTPHSRTYTVFPTRSEPTLPPTGPAWGQYPLDLHAWPPMVPPIHPEDRPLDPRRDR